MTLESGVRVGKYQIGDKLGQGGFGILYVARDTELERDVAVKVLRPEHVFKAQVVQRFLQEARAAARIKHPGIVTVYESGQVAGTNTTWDGTVYIAMELLHGDTLGARIKQAGRLPAGIAIAMCRQIADALVAAHLASIIHRDLKPQNIFIVRDPAVVGGERVKVLDFGIAKLADSFGGNVQTHSLMMLGTPMYMSPEQCKSSAKVDGRSDVYSLGCILFEMLTGRTPFDGDSGELIAKHQLVDAPPARSIVADIPAELDTLVAAMLKKSPDERPQTMSSVLDVLDAIEDRIAPGPEDITGNKPAFSDFERTTVASTAGSRYMQLLRKRSTLAGIAAAAIALGVCGGVVAMRDDPPAKPAAATAAIEPPVAAQAALVPEDAAVHEPTVPPQPTGPDSMQGEIECKQAVADRRWESCAQCDANVQAICTGEAENEVALHLILQAVKAKDLDAAKQALAQIKPESVYRSDGVALVELIDVPTKPVAATATATAAVKGPPPCKAAELKAKGITSTESGNHAAALTQFEASLRCKEDAKVIDLAFMAACSAKNATKAKLYYDLLSPASQTKYAQICDRNKVAYTVPCDAERSKDRGMNSINMGQHASALAQFEASLRCKDDPYVRQLAFMEACAASNSKKAKYYYKQLSRSQQDKFAQICIRQKPPVAYE